MIDDLTKIQSDAFKWYQYNFGPTQQHQCIYGMMEELGELAHAILKQEQGIRAVNADDVKDAIGDLMIFTMQLCNHLNLNLYNVIYETWQKVRQRDWKKFPINGVNK
jgi:NTP pyrophosphatase (non-canonical NTP hydrolase)